MRVRPVWLEGVEPTVMVGIRRSTIDLPSAVARAVAALLAVGAVAAELVWRPNVHAADLRSRARSLGGRLLAHHRPGGGTEIDVVPSGSPARQTVLQWLGGEVGRAAFPTDSVSKCDRFGTSDGAQALTDGLCTRQGTAPPLP